MNIRPFAFMTLNVILIAYLYRRSKWRSIILIYFYIFSLDPENEEAPEELNESESVSGTDEARAEQSYTKGKKGNKKKGQSSGGYYYNDDHDDYDEGGFTYYGKGKCDRVLLYCIPLGRM